MPHDEAPAAARVWFDQDQRHPHGNERQINLNLATREAMELLPGLELGLETRRSADTYSFNGTSSTGRSLCWRTF